MLQWLYTYAAKVCYQCFICVFLTHGASMLIWTLHMFHTYVCMCFIRMLHMVAIVFKCFQVFFFKYFRSIFQVFHLSSGVYCNCCIWMFQKHIECCISPPHLLLNHLSVSSSRRQHDIHTTPRPGPSESETPPPSPLVARAARAWGGAHETECSARAFGRMSGR